MIHYLLTAKLNERQEIWYGIDAAEDSKTVARAEYLSQDARSVRCCVQSLNAAQASLARFSDAVRNFKTEQ